jgi:hypothetical protein
MPQPCLSIRSLAPQVTQAEAVAALTRGRWARIGSGPLRCVAAVYVPFRVYQVDLCNGGRQATSLLAADAVAGTLDPYALTQLPGDNELVTIESANVLPACLDEQAGATLLEGKLRRVVFQRGFFQVTDLAVHARRLPLDVHVPYWLGFCGTGPRARLRVLDAMRGRREGARACVLFEDWLLAPP